jgi:iron-sulfur cluster assembly protein
MRHKVTHRGRLQTRVDAPPARFAAPEAGNRDGRSRFEEAPVLSLTPVAAEAVRKLVEAAPIDDEDGGVRITAGETTPEGTPLQLSLVDGPEPADEAVDELGAHVWIESTIAPFLEDKILDAQVKEHGVTFAVRDQGGAPEMNGSTS